MIKTNKVFEAEYKNLNKEQREAVDKIDGPLMVVAGPGTGKTQILAIRIGNILRKTDTQADGILCLTFTNSAVEAMKKRLSEYIGETAEKINISTFHSFGMKIIESYYSELGLETAPKLLDDADTAILFDEILNGNDWKYLHPRSDASRYFSDLRSLISVLKREMIDSESFLAEIEKEIKSFKSDPENISSRGESKGELKREALQKIDGLERSKEAGKFFKLYEEAKKTKNALDYDDVLENLVKISEVSDSARADIQEKYLYVLVDEHQDSSRVQNEFLRTVWGEVEKPNIMVVGDDRQLIYGFSGASIAHFQGFKKFFKDAELITLVDNYRSTQVILDVSHELLKSVMTDKKLKSQNKEHHPIRIFEAKYPEDEIKICGIEIQKKIKEGIKSEDCAVLVPKNSQVREALKILHSMGLPVSSADALHLFDQEGVDALFRALKIINDPTDSVSLSLSFFDKTSRISPIVAHKYLSAQNMRDFSLNKLRGSQTTLFGDGNAVEAWVSRLIKWQNDLKNKSLKELVEVVGKDLLGEGQAGSLVLPEEILKTVLDLIEKETEKNQDINLGQFLSFIDRLDSYGEHIPVLTNSKEGVKVLTLHSSKGLEFEFVWIAHMDERSLNSGKRSGFAMPESIKERIEDGDADKIKRKLFVAITRAKRFCTLSYANYSAKDSEQEIAKVIADLPEEVFSRHKAEDAQTSEPEERIKDIKELTRLVAEKYKDKYVSVSLLNNFFECPWKWYWRNLLSIPEPTAEILEFGIVVHASVDKILKMSHAPSAEELDQIIIESVLERRLADERMRMRIGREAKAVLSRFVEKRLREIKSSRKTEEAISTKDDHFPHLKFFGKIDLIENLGPKEVRVTDFKTGSVKRKSEIEKIDEEGRMGGLLRQLAMYSYLLQRNPKWAGVDVRESRLEFLESTGKETMYDRVITSEEIDLLVKDIADYDDLVKSGGWVDRECHYNSYGKNEECPYCKMSEVYK